MKALLPEDCDKLKNEYSNGNLGVCADEGVVAICEQHAMLLEAIVWRICDIKEDSELDGDNQECLMITDSAMEPLVDCLKSIGLCVVDGRLERVE